MKGKCVMNKLMLTGRIVRDPEVKAIGDNNMVAKFTIAVNRSYKDKDGNDVFVSEYYYEDADDTYWTARFGIQLPSDHEQTHHL